MDVYMTNADEEPGDRMVLTAEEQITIAALNAAIAYTTSATGRQSMATLAQYASAFKSYIYGEEAEFAFRAPAGMTW